MSSHRHFRTPSAALPVHGDGAAVAALPPPLVRDLVRLLATLPDHEHEHANGGNSSSSRQRHLVDYLNCDDGADTHESRIGAVASSGARIALLRNLFSLTEPECVRAMGTHAPAGWAHEGRSSLHHPVVSH